MSKRIIIFLIIFVKFGSSIIYGQNLLTDVFGDELGGALNDVSNHNPSNPLAEAAGLTTDSSNLSPNSYIEGETSSVEENVQIVIDTIYHKNDSLGIGFLLHNIDTEEKRVKIYDSSDKDIIHTSIFGPNGDELRFDIECDGFFNTDNIKKIIIEIKPDEEKPLIIWIRNVPASLNVIPFIVIVIDNKQMLFRKVKIREPYMLN